MEHKSKLRRSARQCNSKTNCENPLKRQIDNEFSNQDNEEWSIDETDMEYSMWNVSGTIAKDEKDFKENSFILHEESNKPSIKKNKCEYICEKCNEVFYDLSLYKSHMKAHLICKECGELFQTKNSLIQHIKLYHDLAIAKKYECTICNKIVQCLSVHMKIHSEPSISCQYCGKKFTKKAYYKEHLRCHTGEKPYQCKICGNEFAKKYNFNNHLKRHEINRDDFGNYLVMKSRKKSTKSTMKTEKLFNSIQCGTSDQVDLNLIWANSKCCGTNDD